jgi:hypothetical protein
MNKSVWLARLLGIAGVLESAVALALIVDPSLVASILLQSSLGAPGVVIGRIAGGGLLSLGIACWCARNSPTAPASLGVSWGLLAYNVVACMTLAFAGTAMASGGFLSLTASVLHGLFGAALLYVLLRGDQAPAGS